MHKLLYILIAFLVSSFSYGQSSKSLNLMPVPSSINVGEGQFRINEDFSVSIEGNPNDRIYSATTRFLVQLKNRTGVFISQGFV